MAKKDAVISVIPEMGEGELAAQIIGCRVKVKGLEDQVLLFSRMHAANIAYAAFHGLKQRLVDAAAMSRDTTDGSAASPETKAGRITAVIAHYHSGTDKWSRVADGTIEGGLLYDALCRKFGHMRAPSEIKEWLGTLDDKARAALREDDEIAPVIAAIKAERAAKAPAKDKVDTKSLLAGLKPTTPTDVTPTTEAPTEGQ